MGNKAVKAATVLKEKDVKRLAAAAGSTLSEDEVRALHHLFCCLKAAGDGVTATGEDVLSLT